MIQDFIAGDTVRFTQHYKDYPSSDYTSVLYFNGPTNLAVSGAISTPSTDPNYVEDGFLYTITSTQGQYLKAGVYDYALRMTSASMAFTVEKGVVNVQSNYAIAASKEAICTRMIELIEKALLNQLSTGEAAESISIAGRSISMMNRKDLLTERGFWDSERRALVNARLGKTGIKQIEVRI
jgi:hypothetical protein